MEIVIVRTALVLAWLIAMALALAIAGAAGHATGISTLIVGICITYLHTYRGYRATGAHERLPHPHRYPGWGRMWQGAGAHRAVSA